jgi:TRAP-type C4-dicarboxylate transport system permease small subunit
MIWIAERLMRVLDGLLVLNLLAISVIVVAQVLLRYCLSSSITGANEAITVLFIHMSALGAAVAVGRREHIAITIATDTLPSRLRRFVETLHIVGVGIINAVMVLYSLGWIRLTGQYLMPTTELPRAVVQCSVPIGCGLAVFLCLTQLVRTSNVEAGEPATREVPGQP